MAKERTPLLTNHAYYSELCSLAASAFAVSGQLSGAECSDLIEHLPDCADCRELMRNFTQVSFELLPAHSPNRPSSGFSHNGALRRVPSSLPLSARPASEDRLEKEFRKVPRGPALGRIPRWTVVASLAAILMVLASALAFERYRMRHSLHNQSGNTDQSVSVITQATLGTLSKENASLNSELQVAHNRELVLSEERQEHLHALAAAEEREIDLKARIATLEGTNKELNDQDSVRNSQLTQLRRDLEKARSESEANRDAAGLARIELIDRGADLKRVSAELSEAKRFIGTLSEAQDLIEGRAVHVWNVYYADEHGKRQQAYGRILYEDGKKLVFYAYDLADRKAVDTQISFCVWGEKFGTHLPVKSLGVLHIDDLQKGRWKLTFDDPHVLAEINGVFVTAEVSNPVGSGPRGRRMLSASLEIKGNQP
jgi:hypothetical protein